MSYVVLDLEARTIVATGLDSQQAHDFATQLPPALVAADEATTRRIQDAWASRVVIDLTDPVAVS